MDERNATIRTDRRAVRERAEKLRRALRLIGIAPEQLIGQIDHVACRQVARQLGRRLDRSQR